MQEALARGILSYGTHNMSYSHSDKDVAQLLADYDDIFQLLKDGVAHERLEDYLRCDVLVPLFKLR